MAPLIDYRGLRDHAGYELSSTVLAIADEIASAAELVMHKLATRPVAIVRGYEPPLHVAAGVAQDIVMSAEQDLFR